MILTVQDGNGYIFDPTALVMWNFFFTRAFFYLLLRADANLVPSK